MTADTIDRAGLTATMDHIATLRRKQELLKASQIAAEDQLVHRIGQLHAAGELGEVELGQIYDVFARVALPGFTQRWDAAVAVTAARLQYLRRHLRHVEQNAANMPDGTWRGTWPLEGCPVPRDGICVVYVLYDGMNEPCYVGSTGRLRARLQQHARDGKPFAVWTAYRCADREAAYLLEEKLLAEHKLRLNKRQSR